MNTNRRAIAVAFAALMSICAGRGFADETAERARAVYEQNRNAVVTVKLIVSHQWIMAGTSSEATEAKIEVGATVMDPSGLTVLALSSTDPSTFMENFMGGMQGMERDFKMDIQIKDAKIALADGREIPAEIVLRDRELDLAFLRPIEPVETPLAAVDFADHAEAQILDRLVTISQLGRVADRVHAASLERIDAVVEKPRRFYIMGKDNTATGLGSPAFTLDGKVVGIAVLRSVKSDSDVNWFSQGQNESFAGIIRPAEDILESAEQAPPRAEKEKEATADAE